MDTNNNNIDVNRNLSIYLDFYTRKRMFLFLDEWFFYFVLYTFWQNDQLFSFIVVGLYGVSCIHTSYTNLEKIEKIISNIEQKIHFFDNDNDNIYANIFTRTIKE